MQKVKLKVFVIVLVCIILVLYILFEASHTRAIDSMYVTNEVRMGNTLVFEVGTDITSRPYKAHEIKYFDNNAYVIVYETLFQSLRYKFGITGLIEIDNIDQIDAVYLKDSKTTKLIWKAD